MDEWLDVVLELAVAFALYPIILSFMTAANITGVMGTLVATMIPLVLIFAIIKRAKKKLLR
jgi:hypothetical protein